MPHFVIIYQFIKSILDNKMSIFEEYGAFKAEKEDFDKTEGFTRYSGPTLAAYGMKALFSHCNGYNSHNHTSNEFTGK